jgi:FkbM family methyltransferase
MQVPEVLDAGERPLAASAHEELIFDVGMNICDDTDFYLKKGFRVVAVEANPATCAAGAASYPQEIGSGQLTILNRAISETRVPLRFFVCNTQSAWSTASTDLRDQWAKQGAVFEEIEVPGTTAADLIDEFGVPHYAKIDIEGFDLICLKGFQRARARPTYLSVEVDFYKLEELIATLTELGYRRFALVGQSSVPTQRQPLEAQEGRAIDYVFRRGCSGLFGRELPEPWVHAKRLREDCDAVVQQYRLSGALGRLDGVPLVGRTIQQVREKRFPLAKDWYDIHAAL